MENPIKMDDLGVPPFKETPKYGSKIITIGNSGIACWKQMEMFRQL